MKKNPTLNLKLLIIGVLFISIAGGIIGSLISTKIQSGNLANELIKEYYDIENAVLVSPHSLRKRMDKKDTNYILVDLRSPQEYQREHIKTAINIPAYINPDTSAYNEVERITQAFQKLPKDKEIIVYCYSIPCMTGRKIGKMLADHGVYVKSLGIGWNEWRYFWRLWNHEHEWSLTKVEDYIEKGTVSESSDSADYISPCTEGDFDC